MRGTRFEVLGARGNPAAVLERDGLASTIEVRQLGQVVFLLQEAIDL